QTAMLDVRRSGPFDDGDQDAHGLLALSVDRLLHGAEGRIDVRGEIDVVETDDADVARDVETELAQGTHRTDGDDVRHREDRGRSKARIPGPSEGSCSAVDARRALDAVVVADRDADGVESVAIAAQPAGRHAIRMLVAGRRRLDAEHEHIAMAEPREIGGSLARARPHT